MKIGKLAALLYGIILFTVPLEASMGGCGHGMGGGGKVAALMVAMAAGYAVLVLSRMQTRPLDVLGRLVGGLILIISLAGLICLAVCAGMSRFCSKSAGMCPMDAKAGCSSTVTSPTPVAAEPAQ